MAIVHTHKGLLPDARAMLYEDTVDILLWRWDQMKAGGQEESPLLRHLLLKAGRNDVDLKKVLWQLAYKAHRRTRGEDDQEKLADIGELELEKSFAALKDDDYNWARQVMETIKLRAGLLLERAPEVFTFPHRTFQEYLAGAYLASQANFAGQACALAEKEGTMWREVILLAVGRLVYWSGDIDKPLALVMELCPEKEFDDQAGRCKIWLAGDVLLEMGIKRVKDRQSGRELLKRVREQLAALLMKGRFSLRERVAAGDSLGRLGDPRLEGDPMVLISGGTFFMGARKENDQEQNFDKQAYDRESPVHQVELSPFYISKYPVTVGQYGRFIEDGGYKEKCYWKEGRFGRFEKPDKWEEQQQYPSHPVIYVGWYEAAAYAAWAGGRLPTEAEWERVARGPAREYRKYPWGNEEPTGETANFYRSGIGKVSSVGIFPQSCSPEGVIDMAGNVWEWCGDWYSEDYYRACAREGVVKGPLGPENGKYRVLRGGAFDDLPGYLRCAYRGRSDPHDRYDDIGFRVVRVP